MFRKSSGGETEPVVEERPEEKPSADDELLTRLQRMEWPKAPPELRERCWNEISRRITEMEAEGGAAASAQGTGDGAPEGEVDEPVPSGEGETAGPAGESEEPSADDGPSQPSG